MSDFDPDSDQMLRNVLQRIASLQERKELADEQIDGYALALSAILPEFERSGKALPASSVAGVIEAAALTVEQCELATDVLRRTIEDEKGYDAGKLRTSAGDLRAIAAMLEVTARVIDHAAHFPSSE